MVETFGWLKGNNRPRTAMHIKTSEGSGERDDYPSPTSPPVEGEHLKISEAARFTGYTAETVKGWADDPETGCPPYYEVTSKARCFNRREFLEWWASRRVFAGGKGDGQAQ